MPCSSCPLWRLKWSRDSGGPQQTSQHSEFLPQRAPGGVGRLPQGLVCDQCLRKGCYWRRELVELICERLGQTSLEGRPQPLQWPDHHRTGQVSWAPLSSGRPPSAPYTPSPRAAACPLGWSPWPSSSLWPPLLSSVPGMGQSAWGTRWLVPSPPARLAGHGALQGPQLLTGGILQQCCRGCWARPWGLLFPSCGSQSRPSLVWVVRLLV